MVAFYILLLCFSCIVFGYEQGDPVPIYYNKIFSYKTQLTFPFSLLDFSCTSTLTENKNNWLILDRDLRGDRLTKSDFKINLLENQECKVLCKHSIHVENAIQIQDLIEQEYMVEWELEDMPGATVSYSNEAPEHKYKIGFPLGFKKGDRTFINNHVVFQILVKSNVFGKYDIIGFEIYPDSIEEGECNNKRVDYEYQEITGRRTQITFTYSVQWKQVQEEKKWDAYLFKPNKDSQQRSVINGVIVVSLMTCAVVLILFKTRENSPSDDMKLYDDVDDFVGWKLVNRDVFRRPIFGGLLTPLLGGGIQLVSVAIGLIMCLQLGWYHPAQPGALSRWFTGCYVLASVPSGYWSARIYKVFRGKSFILNSILTAILVPSIFIVILFVYSLLTWSQHSSLAISFSGWAAIVSVVLFGILPLTYFGACIGEKLDRIEYPTRTTQIPRMIPKKRWYQSPVVSAVLSGIVPFSIVFLDWNELLTSVTRGEYTLSIEHIVSISILYLICTIEITIVFIFLQLCTEDYRWWWYSIMMGGSSSIYMFVYSILFLFKHTKVEGWIGYMVYSIHMLIGCSLVCLCTGTLGFFSSYVVIRRIYSITKRD